MMNLEGFLFTSSFDIQCSIFAMLSASMFFGGALMSSTFAVIGGSEAHSLLAKGYLPAEPLGAQSTPFGPSQPIFRVSHGQLEFLFLPRQGEKGYSLAPSWINYRANIYALKDLGVERIVSWSGPGAIKASYAIGQFVLPHDVIDETRLRKSTFFENKGLGFIRQSPLFCPNLRAIVLEAVRQLKARLSAADGGVYVCTEGPRLETAAEIRKFATLGADLVGMTLCPEVFLARELEMCYAPICYVTNYAEGVRPAEFVPGRLFEGLASQEEMKAVASSIARFPDILFKTAELLGRQPRPCACARLMERYRKRGDIGPDWRSWVSK
jgi:5'-methylthioadenosine phosphorylase